jgi:hypothetical protein
MRTLLLALLLLPPLASAAEIIASGVTQENSTYTLYVYARIDAPLPMVHATITDFANLAAINPSIEESQVLMQAPDQQRVRTVVSVCILIFCKRVVQVQDVRKPDDHTIEATMVPGAGDFRSGSARWTLQAQDGVTRLRFIEVFEPDFWVPPLIGPWMIEDKLVEEVEVTARYIEQQARGVVAD